MLIIIVYIQVMHAEQISKLWDTDSIFDIIIIFIVLL